MLSGRCASLSVCRSVTLVYCGQTLGWIKMKIGIDVGLSPDHIVLDGDPAHPPPRGTSPQFSVDVCCGQTVGWIKMPLGREVNISPGDIVLDGDPAPPPKEGVQQPSPISAHVCCDQTAGWIKVSLGMKVGLSPGHTVRWEPSPPKGA